jgi:hypothetical protein
MEETGMTKYILPRHPPDALADDCEFWLADDPAGERGYFHIEMLNLPYLEYLLTQDKHFRREVRDIAAYERGYRALQSDELAYFIGNLFYAEPEGSGEGYDYLTTRNCVLGGGTVFEVKNSTGRAPHSATLYLAERDPMTPERVLTWM